MKIEYKMVGTCEQCGKKFCRPIPCDTAVCTCESMTLVPLKPALVLPARIHNKLQKIADSFNASMEQVLSATLRVGLKKIKKLGVEEVLGLANGD